VGWPSVDFSHRTKNQRFSPWWPDLWIFSHRKCPICFSNNPHQNSGINMKKRTFFCDCLLPKRWWSMMFNDFPWEHTNMAYMDVDMIVFHFQWLFVGQNKYNRLGKTCENVWWRQEIDQ
jgi:hypothetical protein